MATCQTCDMPLMPSGKPGRPVAYCDDDCRIKGGLRPLLPRPRPELRKGTSSRMRGPRRTTPCTECGKPMQVTPTLADVPRCQPCRRAAHGLAPDQKVNDNLRKRPTTRACPRCAVEFTTVRRTYCSDACALKARYARGSGKPPTTQRGYGRPHQNLRKELLPYAYDTPCCLCGDLMLVGQKLHLDHTEDRSDYRGFAHAECNVREGARRGIDKKRQRAREAA